MDLNEPQPPPDPEWTIDAWDMVIDYTQARIDQYVVRPQPTLEALREDMRQRRRLGLVRYGVPVHPANGRDSLRDIYEELLDATVYAMNLQLQHQDDPPGTLDAPSLKVHYMQLWQDSWRLALRTRWLISERERRLAQAPQGAALSAPAAPRPPAGGDPASG